MRDLLYALALTVGVLCVGAGYAWASSRVPLYILAPAVVGFLFLSIYLERRA